MIVARESGIVDIYDYANSKEYTHRAFTSSASCLDLVS